jgi:ketosteroid isomerase-like protein
MKPLAVFAGLLAATNLSAQAAPRMTGTLPAAERAHLEAVRKDVWVNWFSGDTAALRRVLAPELIAVSPSNATWSTLGDMIAGSARFKANGNEFVSVKFDTTAMHTFGNVVVMFSTYAVVTRHEGKESTQAGHATEVFVRHGKDWVHTSWHLDVK